MDEKLVIKQVGYLVLKDDGTVLESGGDLQNDERTGRLIMELLQITESIDDNFIAASNCERVSIVFEECILNVCLCNRRVYVMQVRSTPEKHTINNAVYTETDISNTQIT